MKKHFKRLCKLKRKGIKDYKIMIKWIKKQPKNDVVDEYRMHFETNLYWTPFDRSLCKVLSECDQLKFEIRICNSSLTGGLNKYWLEIAKNCLKRLENTCVQALKKDNKAKIIYEKYGNNVISVDIENITKQHKIVLSEKLKKVFIDLNHGDLFYNELK